MSEEVEPVCDPDLPPEEYFKCLAEVFVDCGGPYSGEDHS
jgi:hypothetical protein